MEWRGIHIVNKSNNKLPKCPTTLSSEMGIPAFTDWYITINPKQIMLINTGLFVDVPPEYEIHIRPNRDLVVKEKITIFDTPFVIGANNHNEIQILLVNHSNYPFEVRNGDIIAKMALQKVQKSNR